MEMESTIKKKDKKKIKTAVFFLQWICFVKNHLAVMGIACFKFYLDQINFAEHCGITLLK